MLETKDALIMWLLAENQRLRLESNTDTLTGLGNRRKFGVLYDQTFQQAMRFLEPIALIVFDIDGFKNINTIVGHIEADKILCRVAAISSQNIRKSDNVMRHGGEEFIVLRPRTDLIAAVDVASRIRSEIARNISIIVSQNVAPVTVSLGVAAITPTSPWQQSDLIKTAYRRMNFAKFQGKNCVVTKN